MTDQSEYSLSAEAVVNASANEVFDFLAKPANHKILSGDDSVRGQAKGAEVLAAVGDKFGMSMKMRLGLPGKVSDSPGRGLPYSIKNTVVRCDPPSALAWRHMGKHVWLWEMEAIDDNTCRVTETVDFGPSPMRRLFKLLGFPAAHKENLERSLKNLQSHFSA